MSNNVLAAIFTPIVVAILLAGWIIAVIYADKHPGWKYHGPPPRSDVAGGAFEATDGGRQLMPLWGEPPHDIPAQRAAAGDESHETAQRGEPGPQDAAGRAGERRAAGVGRPPS